MHPVHLFPASFRRNGVVRAAAFSLLLGATGVVLAQTQNGQSDDRRRRGGDDANNGRRGNFSPEDAQARMMSSLRERLEVADDEEWKIISERLGKVMELRRNNAAGSFGGFGGFAFGGRGPGGGDASRNDASRGDANRGGRSTRTSGNTEMAALQSAVRDKLPDAEIKSRLERVRESRRDNEAKLSKAQEELRAVLSVRQEAVAVMFGFLP
jgi:hypothetical protein